MAIRNELTNGMRYGVFVGCLLAVGRLGPVAWVCVWLLVFCQFCVGASVIWTRTRLPLMAAGMFVGAIEALLMGIWIGGADALATLFSSHPVLAVSAALGPAILMYSEARFHPDAWRRIRQHDGPWTVRDMLLLRHIPNLRSAPSTKAPA